MTFVELSVSGDELFVQCTILARTCQTVEHDLWNTVTTLLLQLTTISWVIASAVQNDQQTTRNNATQIGNSHSSHSSADATLTWLQTTIFTRKQYNVDFGVVNNCCYLLQTPQKGRNINWHKSKQLSFTWCFYIRATHSWLGFWQTQNARHPEIKIHNQLTKNSDAITYVMFKIFKKYSSIKPSNYSSVWQSFKISASSFPNLQPGNEQPGACAPECKQM